MKIKEIYVELGVKKSKDFQSCTNTVGLRGELEADDDPIAIVIKLQQQCHKLLLKEMFPKAEHAEAAQ
jgi:hypothetical protein